MEDLLYIPIEMHVFLLYSTAHLDAMFILFCNSLHLLDDAISHTMFNFSANVIGHLKVIHPGEVYNKF